MSIGVIDITTQLPRPKILPTNYSDAMRIFFERLKTDTDNKTVKDNLWLKKPDGEEYTRISHVVHILEKSFDQPVQTSSGPKSEASDTQSTFLIPGPSTHSVTPSVPNQTAVFSLPESQKLHVIDTDSLAYLFEKGTLKVSTEAPSNNSPSSAKKLDASTQAISQPQSPTQQIVPPKRFWQRRFFWPTVGVACLVGGIFAYRSSIQNFLNQLRSHKS